MTFWPESLLTAERVKESGDRTIGLRAAGQSELKKYEKGVPIRTDTFGTKGEEE